MSVTESVAVVRVEDLHKRYQAEGPEAVAGVDFEVLEGEIFGLLGPNGAGKTTTIGTITTRVKPTGGRVLVDGVDVSVDPVSAKLRIAAVPQMSNLDRALTALENLTFHAAYFGAGRRERRERARELLARFGLGGRENDHVNNYSGGMAQRLMIARAIFHRPAVLFLDEPTAGLDPQGRLALWETLGELSSEGQTIVLLTHYMEEADQLCSRVAIMDHGTVLALDTPAALKHSVGADTIVTVKATGDRARLRDVLGHDLEGVERSRLVNGGVELLIKGAPRLLPRVVQAADAAGFDVVDLSVAEPTLETVFINLTGKELRE